MFEKALIALDLSPAEKPLLDCLPDLQRWGVRHFVLTHVIRFGYVQGAALAHQSDYVDWLETCADRLRANGLSVEVQLRTSGDPAEEILILAREIRADLVVVGSRGQNMLSKFFLGGVSRNVIRKSTVPVLLEWIEPIAEETRVRCQAVCTDTLRHIVLATDFSHYSQAAENAAFALAPKAKQVDCAYVVAANEKPALDESAAQTAINNIVIRITALGIKSSATILRGKPSAEIAHYAASHNASLIVVGKHGQNWMASTLIGSTAANLCEIAGRPVLMVP